MRIDAGVRDSIRDGTVIVPNPIMREMMATTPETVAAENVVRDEIRMGPAPVDIFERQEIL